MARRAGYVSTPLAFLLRRAGLAPMIISEGIEAQARLGAPALLRKGNCYVESVSQITGFNIVSISRRHRYLLARIEQYGNDGLTWTYEEESRNRCRLSTGGIPPIHARLGLNGRTSGHLADFPPPFEALALGIVTQTHGGWTSAEIDPQWQPF